MTGIQPELWVDRAAAAVAFYTEAFGATVLHRVALVNMAITLRSQYGIEVEVIGIPPE